MFCSTAANNLINKIHKRDLRVVCEMEVANFKDLFVKDKSWSIHKSNTYTLLIESLSHISPPIMEEYVGLKVNLFEITIY